VNVTVETPADFTLGSVHLFTTFRSSENSVSQRAPYADGQKVDLKEASTTIYCSDTPRIVSVDPRSVVNALAPGSATITVSNSRAKVEIPVVVAAPVAK
jgi:hypothetical protein